MGQAAIGDGVEEFVRCEVGDAARVDSGPVWVRVRPRDFSLPAHGWKLHVSARVREFADIVEIVLPVLLDEGCAFKLARSRQVLSDLNDGRSSPATVGKAFTIYPDQRRVRELGLRLAELLRGRRGPRILSDRQIHTGAPVYYRYGPFRGSSWRADSHGRLVNPLRGPGGEEFDGVATLTYRQPSWAVDPFTGQAAATGQAIEGGQEPAAPPRLGGRYLVTGGLYQSARGNVFTAVDEHDDHVVIIKQARALVAEQGEQNDTRLRLRNERRILQALDGVPGVPRFLDHFQHADDEFLVTTDCGPRTLMRDVLERGLYREGVPAGPRRLDLLAARLARIVRDVHGRGVIIRDLSPKNVVTGAAEIAIIDFGIAGYEDLHLPGGTPGYSPARQFRGEPPRDTDDLYALGMTLLFAATMLDPVCLGQDPELPRLRALQAIRHRFGDTPPPVMAAIVDLISADGERAAAAFCGLAGGQRPAKSLVAPFLAAAAPLPAVPRVTPEVAAEVAEALRDDLLDQAEEILRGGSGGPADHDGNIYSGTAGLGLELLHHVTHERAAEVTAALVPFTARAAALVNLPPGLFVGVTGVDIFLRRAADHGFGGPGGPVAASIPGPAWEPVNDDLVVGAAGVGLGHLELYRATGDPAHMDVARACASRLGQFTPAGPPSMPPGPAGPAGPAGPPDLSFGSAHGLAGVTGFLVALAGQTADEADLAVARRHVARLAGRTRVLIGQARTWDAPPLTVSWCRGLAGIGATLLYAGAVLGGGPPPASCSSLTELASEAADVCLAYLPRLSALGRCCGVCGIGSLLADLALATADDGYWDAADAAAVQMLLRSGGKPSHPVFIDKAPPGSNTSSWAFGLTGLLGFFRRLADRGGPDSLPLYTPFREPARKSRRSPAALARKDQR